MRKNSQSRTKNNVFLVRPPQNGCLDAKRYQRRNCVQKIGSQALSYVENGPNEDFRFLDFVNPITLWDLFSY